MDNSPAISLYTKVCDGLDEFMDNIKPFRRDILVIYTVSRRDYGVKFEILVKTRDPTHTLSYNLVRIRSQVQSQILSTIFSNTYNLISDYVSLVEIRRDCD